MAGFKRNARGQFLGGFSGMSAVRKKKFMSAKKVSTKQRMDKQNLITRTAGDLPTTKEHIFTKESIPLKTNVRDIRPHGKKTIAVKGRATSTRDIKTISGQDRTVTKGTGLNHAEVKLSKNQQQRVDDYMARPKRMKAGAAKKKQAFASTGGPSKAEPVNKPKNALEGRDARGMSDAQKIDAYTQMHGKPPTDAQLKKLGNRAPATHAADRNARTKKLEDMGSRTSKDKIASDSARLAAWEAASRPKTNATPSVSPSRDNSTPAAKAKPSTKHPRVQAAEKELADLQEQFKKDDAATEASRFAQATRGVGRNREAEMSQDRRTQSRRAVQLKYAKERLAMAKKETTPVKADPSRPVSDRDIQKFRQMDIMDYNAMTSAERNALEEKVMKQFSTNRQHFTNHDDNKPYTKKLQALLPEQTALETILKRIRVSRRNMGG